MQFNTITYSPHTHQGNSVNTVMRQVLYALIPGIITYIYFFGWGVMINIILASLLALSLEALMLWLRGRPIRPFLSDNSALVTAWLFALAIPPFLPWWMTLIGIFFAIVFAKHLYGGLGYNPFNPAMVGYVVLLVSFPIEMTRWPAVATLSGYYPSFLDSLSLIFTGDMWTTVLKFDDLTGATPLDTMKTALKDFQTVQEVKIDPLFGDFGAKGWEWIANAYFLGGFWLIYKRIIDWRIPLAMLTSLFAIASVFFIFNPDAHPSPLFHLFSGAAILGAFFIATDPVTAATSIKGRIYYGIGIGLLIYIIRTWGGYPDGVAFAILLMNMTVPAIDYLTQPRVFGHNKR